MKSFQMKKLASTTVFIGAALFTAMPAAHAATASQTFNVTAGLSAMCTVGAIPDLTFGNYVAFQPTPITATTALAITCSRGLTAPTYSFDVNNFGVIAGLNYQLSAAAGTVTAGTAASTVLNGIGTGDARTVTITGDMPANQAGDCAGNAASCAATVTQVRTITVTY